MSSAIDAVLLLGFGGPEGPAEIRPFLADVLEGKNVPPERVEKVVKQYEAIGGSSPYRKLTLGQAGALEKLLKARGLDLPVHAAFIHSNPQSSLRVGDLLGKLSGKGVFAIVMAPHRSPASYDKYVKKVDEALAEMKKKGLTPPQITYAPQWHDRPGFIHAVTDRIYEAAAGLTPEERRSVEMVFTAHSIPAAMAAQCPYASQLHETARLVQERLGVPYYQMAYQSRSGRPEEPWLEPDVGDFLEARGRSKLKAAVVSPIGFLVDHVEVLYDLDVLAKERARTVELRMLRAGTVGDHPHFIAMLSGLVEEAVGKNQ